MKDQEICSEVQRYATTSASLRHIKKLNDRDEKMERYKRLMLGVRQAARENANADAEFEAEVIYRLLHTVQMPAILRSELVAAWYLALDTN